MKSVVGGILLIIAGVSLLAMLILYIADALGPRAKARTDRAAREQIDACRAFRGDPILSPVLVRDDLWSWRLSRCVLR